VPNPDDLAGLVDRARAGDETAITRLFRAPHPQLIGYARHHAPDAAEDLVAETWLAAARGLASFEGDAGDFRAWLFAIARRRVADHYRNRARRPGTVPLDEASEPPTSDLADLVVEGLSSDQAVAALLRDLTPDQAEVVLLRVVAGLSVEQVAAVMERSSGAVRALQHKALRRLAKASQPGQVTR
jgi:RNA polymerase sigma-70 factor (ECF subfamily)